MKFKKVFMLSLLCAAMGFTGCDDGDGPDPDTIWDIYPFAINIYVTDKQGNDLLNPETENSIADNGIKAIFRGNTYEKDSTVAGNSRAILAFFYGLASFEYNDTYGLSFGDFNGETNFERETLVLDWNDGSKRDTITFSRRFWWKNHKPQSENTFWLNGVETEAPIRIVK